MNGRRSFLKRIALLPALFLPGTATNALPGRRVTIQTSPINGMAYYEADRVLPALRVGDTLELRREPDNRHDDRAVEVYWRNRKLGYLPRVENAAVAQMADAGQWLECSIVDIVPSNFPWDTVRVRVDLVVR